jgi:hypothetical protein
MDHLRHGFATDLKYSLRVDAVLIFMDFFRMSVHPLNAILCCGWTSTDVWLSLGFCIKFFTWVLGLDLIR